MTGKRLATSLVLCLVAGAVVSAPGVAKPAPPPISDLDPLFYGGTLRPAVSCASTTSCADFDATLTNTSKVTVNSWMVTIANDPLTKFSVDGASCTANGSKFGAKFDNGWLCLGLYIPPGAVVLASGTALHPLTTKTTARFDWSPAGTIRGLLPDSSQDMHFYWGITPLARLDLEGAETDIESALFFSTGVPGETLVKMHADARKAAAAIAQAEAEVKDAEKTGAFLPGAATEILKLLDAAHADYVGFEPRVGFKYARTQDLHAISRTAFAGSTFPR